MALRNISLNFNNLLFIVTIIFFIPQFINSDTKVNYHSLNYIGLVPLHYDVKIELDFERNVLFGECNITINITRQMKSISVPSKNFGILKIDVINKYDSQIIIVPNYSFIDERYIYIDFTNSSVNVLFPGTYTLEIIYVRNIFDNEIFLGSFYNEEGGEKKLTETGIEVIKAQQIFPCSDESASETTFTISVKHHKKYTVLSNMDIMDKQYKKDYEMMWTHFRKTPSMSIERLMIVITTFTHLFNTVTNITLWTRSDIIDKMIYIQNILHMVVNILQNKSWTKIPKIDYIAIWDTQQSNIKTWGLIVHRGEDVTVNELDPITHKIKVISFLTHQIISVWYDYLLWPIEGFITYRTVQVLGKVVLYSYHHKYEELLIAAVEFLVILPLSDINNLLDVQMQQESLHFDIPSYTNTMLFNSNGLDVEINKAFLNYIKPPILWRVLQHLINEEILLESIRTYCNRYNQSNTIETDDLWHIMQTNLNQTNQPRYFNVKKYIDTWKKTNYYPIVYAARNDKNNTMLFSYLSSDFIDKDVEQLPVLVTFRAKLFGSIHKRAFWLSPQETNIIGRLQKNDCVIVNIEQGGYYRVNYDSESWLKLAQCLISENYEIHVVNQAQIIDDAFYFLKSKQLTYTTFWKVVYFLSNNTNYIAWYPMIKAFEYMVCAYSLDDSADIMKNMKKILNGVLQLIGYHEDFYENKLNQCLRLEVAKWACILDVAECRKAATLQLMEELKSPVQDNNSLTWKEWKYCRGLMSANYTIWNNTLQKWTTTSDNRILNYLTCCEDPFIITTYLNLTLGLTEHKSIIKEQDIRVNIILRTIAKHVNDQTVLDFLFRRLQSKTFKLSENNKIDTTATLIVAITNIHNPYQLQKIKNFAKLLKDKRLFDFVKKKIIKRKSEHLRQITNYGFFART